MSDLERKIEGACKGVLTCLDPLLDNGKKIRRDQMRLDINSPDRRASFSYPPAKIKNLCDRVKTFLTHEVTDDLVWRYLVEIIPDNYKQEGSVSSEFLDEAAKCFLRKLKKEEKMFDFYFPIQGLHFNGSFDLEVVNGCFFCNHSQSEFVEKARLAVERGISKDFIDNCPQTPVFFKVSSSGQTAQEACRKAKDDVELALNVLRLFVGSYYHDIQMMPTGPRFMRVEENILTGNRRGYVLYETDDGVIGPSGWRYDHWQSFVFRDEQIKRCKKYLPRINELLCSCSQGIGSRQDFAGRLLRVVNWFGKASIADSIAESFLLYAMSLESLLSEGRTPKETYGERVAALIMRSNFDWICPGDENLFSSFKKELDEASSESERFEVIKKEIIDLFKYRNLVAHGNLLQTEIKPDKLLTLEFLVRNSVLSFIDGGWQTLEKFKASLIISPGTCHNANEVGSEVCGQHCRTK